jgi:hypothetical protein
MAWLFERTVELGAWVSLVMAWVTLGLALWFFGQWVSTFQIDSDPVVAAQLLFDAGKCAGAFVGFALALGGLACVDRFLFDADEK